jgi:hypothetical protein
MMMTVEQSVEWELAGETEVLRENLPQCHFVHHKSHMTYPWIEPRTSQWEAWRLTVWAMAWPDGLCHYLMVAQPQKCFRCTGFRNWTGSANGIIPTFVLLTYRVIQTMWYQQESTVSSLQWLVKLVQLLIFMEILNQIHSMRIFHLYIQIHEGICKKSPPMNYFAWLV